MKKANLIIFLMLVFLIIFNCPTQDSSSGGGGSGSGDSNGDDDGQVKLSGLLDTSFDPGTGADAAIYSIAIQSDGKIVIAGDFTSYNGTPIEKIARLNTDGSLDSTFIPGSSVNGFIDKVAVQTDGKILITGYFSSYRGYTRNNIVRINSNGTLDTSFDPDAGTDGRVTSMEIQSDGKILICGYFENYNSTYRKYVARVDTDGSLDTSFDPGTGASSNVGAIIEQSDGKILIGGNFGAYNGTLINRIARINSNGAIDASFDPGTGADSFISSLILQSDEKILISGYFNNYNGINRKHIARINSDGSFDTSFGPGTGVDSYINSLTVQSDGKILIGGDFTSYNDVLRNRIARINVDGSLDVSFATGTGAGDSIYSIAIQFDGKIIIAGNFTSYNDTSINRITRITGD